MAKYLIKKTGRDLVLWKGYCQVHAIFSLKDLKLTGATTNEKNNITPKTIAVK